MQVHSISGLESDLLRQDFRGCRILQRNLGAPQVQLHFCAVALCNAHGSNTYCCWERKNKGGVTRFQNKSVSCAVAPLGWTLRPIGLRDVVELECRSLMVTSIKTCPLPGGWSPPPPILVVNFTHSQQERDGAGSCLCFLSYNCISVFLS